MNIGLRFIFVLFTLLWGAPLWAVEPDEVLENPALEERAREISKDLRCLVCQNESIDDSNADVARDLRLLVRERLVAGDSDREVRAYIVERFGEFVLLKPLVNKSTAILWLSGPILFIMAGLIIWLAFRTQRAQTRPEATLSVEEEEALKKIMAQKE